MIFVIPAIPAFAAHYKYIKKNILYLIFLQHAFSCPRSHLLQLWIIITHSFGSIQLRLLGVYVCICLSASWRLSSQICMEVLQPERENMKLPERRGLRKDPNLPANERSWLFILFWWWSSSHICKRSDTCLRCLAFTWKNRWDDMKISV